MKGIERIMKDLKKRAKPEVTKRPTLKINAIKQNKMMDEAFKHAVWKE